MNVSKTGTVIDVSEKNLVFALQYDTINRVSIIIRPRQQSDTEENSLGLTKFRAFPNIKYRFLEGKPTTLGHISIKYHTDDSISYEGFYPLGIGSLYLFSFLGLGYGSALELLFLREYQRVTQTDPVLFHSWNISPERVHMLTSQGRYLESFPISVHCSLIQKYILRKS